MLKVKGEVNLQDGKYAITNKKTGVRTAQEISY